eukprot:TRINITY_DN3865_c0_g1_i2.p1 TRINITY_DN3865_c0_g1~~TRINITY_DN3865_c0_g1_i2.p1  ORF type:complete len:717 (+),score=32.46 TRINITY_DN3865_c0_g1_i2:680-2830(+)
MKAKNRWFTWQVLAELENRTFWLSLILSSEAKKGGPEAIPTVPPAEIKPTSVPEALSPTGLAQPAAMPQTESTSVPGSSPARDSGRNINLPDAKYRVIYIGNCRALKEDVTHLYLLYELVYAFYRNLNAKIKWGNECLTLREVFSFFASMEVSEIDKYYPALFARICDYANKNGHKVIVILDQYNELVGKKYKHDSKAQLFDRLVRSIKDNFRITSYSNAELVQDLTPDYKPIMCYNTKDEGELFLVVESILGENFEKWPKDLVEEFKKRQEESQSPVSTEAKSEGKTEEEKKEKVIDLCWECIKAELILYTGFNYLEVSLFLRNVLSHETYAQACEEYSLDAIKRYNRMLDRSTDLIDSKERRMRFLNAIANCGKSLVPNCVIQPQMMYIDEMNIICAVCPIALRVLNTYFFSWKKTEPEAITSKLDDSYREFREEKEGRQRGIKLERFLLDYFQGTSGKEIALPYIAMKKYESDEEITAARKELKFTIQDTKDLQEKYDLDTYNKLFPVSLTTLWKALSSTFPGIDFLLLVVKKITATKYLRQLYGIQVTNDLVKHLKMKDSYTWFMEPNECVPMKSEEGKGKGGRKPKGYTSKSNPKKIFSHPPIVPAFKSQCSIKDEVKFVWMIPAKEGESRKSIVDKIIAKNPDKNDIIVMFLNDIGTSIGYNLTQSSRRIFYQFLTYHIILLRITCIVCFLGFILFYYYQRMRDCDRSAF